MKEPLKMATFAPNGMLVFCWELKYHFDKAKPTVRWGRKATGLNLHVGPHLSDTSI